MALLRAAQLTRAREVEGSKIHIDPQQFVVILPVLGTPWPVHASYIKGAVKDKQTNVIRVQFNLEKNLPGTSVHLRAPAPT